MVIETKGMGVLPTLKDARHTPIMIANAMIIGQAVGWMAAEKGGEEEGVWMGGGEGLDRCQRDVISPPVNLAGLEAGGIPGIVIDPWVATVREDETATGAGTTEADHFRGPQTKEIREIVIYATALLEFCAARLEILRFRLPTGGLSEGNFMIITSAVCILGQGQVEGGSMGGMMDGGVVAIGILIFLPEGCRLEEIETGVVMSAGTPMLLGGGIFVLMAFMTGEMLGMYGMKEKGFYHAMEMLLRGTCAMGVTCEIGTAGACAMGGDVTCVTSGWGGGGGGGGVGGGWGGGGGGGGG